jgi:hypothetical protein
MLVTPKLKVFRSILSATVVKKPRGSPVSRIGFAIALEDIANQKHNPKNEARLPFFPMEDNTNKSLAQDFMFEIIAALYPDQNSHRELYTLERDLPSFITRNAAPASDSLTRVFI